MAAYVYMVECADGSLYTGWTMDIPNRIAAHNDGTGARYTRGRGPVRLAYMEEVADKQTAQKREWAIKKLTRLQKEQMVSSFDLSSAWVKDDADSRVMSRADRLTGK